MFLYLAFTHVHTATPNIPGLQYSGCNFVNQSRRGTFGDAVTEMDWMVGEVYSMFERLNQTTDTLFFFTSDNGPSLRWGKSAGSMGLFTGRAANYTDTGKGSTWEGGIRMPAFAVWPGVIAPASTSAEMVSSLDIFPTIAKLIGVALPTDRTYDGREFTDILLNEGGATTHAFLPFYNEPAIANASSRIFAARMGPSISNANVAPLCFKNGAKAKSGLKMCFDIGSLHLGCWGQNTPPYAQGCDLS